jgi:hypothetical protein
MVLWCLDTWIKAHRRYALLYRGRLGYVRQTCFRAQFLLFLVLQLDSLRLKQKALNVNLLVLNLNRTHSTHGIAFDTLRCSILLLVICVL